jgi:enoyl-CoA hydratase/carnithine racemase
MGSSVAWLVLNRPDQGNPIDEELVDELAATWTELARDTTVKAIGLGATGPAFSVGAPLGAAHAERAFGPKSCGCYLPVLVELAGDIGSAAFPLLGEADVVVAAPDIRLTMSLDERRRADALHLRPRLPEAEIRRLALMGGFEPLSAQRAAELGAIDTLVARADLHRHAAVRLRAMARDTTIG